MKYDSHDGSTVSSNIADEGVRMGIDPSSLAHVISVLTDLYGDPAGASIREYATNGWDAQVEAGVTEPLQVFLPSDYTAIYEVVDKGVGMSAAMIQNEFGQYGYSSKRDSDDFNGMLGLGCKSALTYTPQFTVVSVREGIETKALIVRGQDGVGSVKIVSERQTDEPNGTSVQIPVIDVDTFNRKAREFFRYWAKGTVLVNGEEPQSIFEDPEVIKLDEDILILPSDHDLTGDRVRVVMGNVAYTLDQRWSNLVTGPLAHRATVIARVPIGSVNIPPNREALSYTPKTEDLLRLLADYVKDATRRRFDERIAKAMTPGEAMSIASEARRVLYSYKVEWQGRSVPTSVEFGGHGSGLSFGLTWGSGANLWNQTARDLTIYGNRLRPDVSKGVLVVNNYGLVSVSSINKAKVQHWVQTQTDRRFQTVLFREATHNRLSIWVDDSPDLVFVDWEDIKKVNLPPTLRREAGPSASTSRRGPSTAAPSADLSEVRSVNGAGDYNVVSQDWVKGRARVVMIAPTDLKKAERGHLASKLSTAGTTLIVVNKNRHDDAREVFPNLMSEEEAIKEGLQARFDRLDWDGIEYHREFFIRQGYSSARSAAEALVRDAREVGGEFGEHHSLRSIEAILNRVDAAKQAHTAAINLHREVFWHGRFDESVLPEGIMTLKERLDEEVDEKIDLDPVVRRHMDRFKAKYPLFIHVKDNSAALQEYLRLLEADGS